MDRKVLADLCIFEPRTFQVTNKNSVWGDWRKRVLINQQNYNNKLCNQMWIVNVNIVSVTWFQKVESSVSFNLKHKMFSSKKQVIVMLFSHVFLLMHSLVFSVIMNLECSHLWLLSCSGILFSKSRTIYSFSSCLWFVDYHLFVTPIS